MEEPALKTHYRENVIPTLQKSQGYTNIMQVPKILKVTINSGIGKADDRKAAAEEVAREIGVITGQKPIVTKAKNAISNFKLRAGEPVGVKVTLRGRQMYEFLERFMKIAIPTIRDFRGVSLKAFDGRGNYTLGIQDQTIFPEIELEKVKRTTGFDVSIVTSANTDDEARELLALMGMPFRKPAAKEGEQAA
ncbi:MAG: 50S ribosomal protein L5 [Verrucomicrobiota bacterium]